MNRKLLSVSKIFVLALSSIALCIFFGFSFFGYCFYDYLCVKKESEPSLVHRGNVSLIFLCGITILLLEDGVYACAAYLCVYFRQLFTSQRKFFASKLPLAITSKCKLPTPFRLM